MTSITASRIGARAHLDVQCDARWTMAFAAAVGDRSPATFDTAGRDGCNVHPMFSVAVEWALLTARADPFGLGLSSSDEVAGIHVSHALQAHRTWRSPGEILVLGQVVSLREVQSGVLVDFQFTASDRPTGLTLWTTMMGMIYLGVTLEGAASALVDERERTAGEEGGAPFELAWEAEGGFAHVYTECARIWNPIHTDVSVARQSGLTGPILHGTATLARTVTEIVRHLEIDPSRIRAAGGEFRAMVALPSVLRVQARISGGDDRSTVQFITSNEIGEHAVRHGYLEYDN